MGRVSTYEFVAKKTGEIAGKVRKRKIIGRIGGRRAEAGDPVSGRAADGKDRIGRAAEPRKEAKSMEPAEPRLDEAHGPTLGMQ